MASIVTRGKSYSVVYMDTVDGARKQKWETYHSLEKAKIRVEQINLCCRQKKARDTHLVETVEQLMEVYIQLYGIPRWSFSTYQANCGLVRHYILPQLGSMRLTELTPRVVAELYRRLLTQTRVDSPYHHWKGQTISACTLHSIHKVLHSAFEQAILWEYVTRNPFYRAPLPKMHSRHQKFLTPTQIEALLPHCDRMLSLGIHLAFAGSFRKGELLALTWEDVDFNTGAIHINKTLSRISQQVAEQLNNRDILFAFPSGSRKQQTLLVLKRPKTESSVRIVYLPKTVLQALKNHQSLQSRNSYTVVSDAPDMIFCYEDGRPIQESTLTKYFHAALQQAGLPKVSFHSLRHSSITYKLILSGGNIKAVQGDSGHAQADMIIETYGHILDQCRRDNAVRFEQDFYKD